MWNKIKSFFGFRQTKEETLTSKEKKVIMDTYKVEPKVIEVDMEKAVLPVGITAEPKGISTTPKGIKKVTKGVKSVPKNKAKTVLATKVKVKRHWYNNGKTQKLVPEGEILPKTWKKGKLKK